MINVSVDNASLKRLQDALKDKSRRLPREVATAINATAKKVRIEASRLLKKELNVPSKILKKAIKTKSKATAENTQAVVGLWEGYPIPLKYFKPTQLKRGVTYKIDPKLKGKSVLRDAFIVKSYGGKVYRRKSKARGPIEQVYGPSPGTVFGKAGIAAAAEKVAREELPKQIERRIRFLELKSSGGLRGNQK
jgi:hypothetical protein